MVYGFYYTEENVIKYTKIVDNSEFDVFYHKDPKDPFFFFKDPMIFNCSEYKRYPYED